MWVLIGVIAGFILSLGSVYLGFWLARLSPSATPEFPKIPESYGGAILDAAVYPDQAADE